jgi:hypothetical protein
VEDDVAADREPAQEVEALGRQRRIVAGEQRVRDCGVLLVGLPVDDDGAESRQARQGEVQRQEPAADRASLSYGLSA